MDSKTLHFTKPLEHPEHPGKKVESITLREPNGMQVLAAEKAGVAETGAASQRVRDGTLIAGVAGVHLDLVRKMPAGQFKQAAAFLNAFSKPRAGAAPDLTQDLVIPVPRIEQDGRIVTELELREPTTGEVEEAQRKLGNVVNAATLRESQTLLIALVTELPRFCIDRVPVSKLDQASQYLLGFT